MNFFNDRELARRFKAETVPPKERFYYLIIYILFFEIINSSLFNNWISEVEEPSWWVDGFNLAIIFFGTILCYCANAKGDNKEFIERYICIGFPIAVQVFILEVVLIGIINFTTGLGMFISKMWYIAAMAINGTSLSRGEIDIQVHNMFGNIITVTEIENMILEFIVGLYFYLRLRSSIKIAAH
ncbi:MAG: hypothetical protein K1X44_05890 [Alphaproteobacteria bacterium]|nr:hypothetical protein [Alphaproteobacteria bacterium]